APLGLGAAQPCRSADIGDVATDPPGVVPNVPVEIRFSCATLTVPLDHGLLPGPPGAVTACARDLGADRRFYSTASTVADLDTLRAALGVATVSLDGASYGTFVAERYAMTYPDRVPRVLDSVVPHDGLDPMELDELSAGLHAATTCQDMVGPWGGAASPAAGRAAGTAAAVAAVADAAFFPFDRATATDNGQVAVCQQWPATPVVPFAAGRDLSPVPVLVLAGDHDTVRQFLLEP
ncbi:MAG TPA: alpha/beta hydrolase, partial [Pseudonocardia sp.]|nr:alpha/beta hydrolase [Pseudonocardia sp.]